MAKPSLREQLSTYPRLIVICGLVVVAIGLASAIRDGNHALLAIWASLGAFWLAGLGLMTVARRSARVNDR
jgi:hypothetical protein